VDPEFASVQAGVSAPAYAAAHATAHFDDESDAQSSRDDPPLERCKRELDAVLASLDPETS
jgi:hypothetical protein